MIPMLEKLQTKFANDARSAEDEFVLLAVKIADNSATDAEVVRALKSSGKSIQDLQVAVLREQKIRALQAVAAGLPDAIANAEKAEAAQSAFHLRRQQIGRDLIVECNSVVTAFQAADLRRSECLAARDKLRELGVSTIDEAA